MFYPRRVLDINDGKPKWTGINKASEIVTEGPADSAKKRKRPETEEGAEKEEKQDGAEKEKKQEHSGDNAEAS